MCSRRKYTATQKCDGTIDGLMASAVGILSLKMNEIMAMIIRGNRCHTEHEHIKPWPVTVKHAPHHSHFHRDWSVHAHCAVAATILESSRALARDSNHVHRLPIICHVSQHAAEALRLQTARSVLSEIKTGGPCTPIIMQ